MREIWFIVILYLPQNYLVLYFILAAVIEASKNWKASGFPMIGKSPGAHFLKNKHFYPMWQTKYQPKHVDTEAYLPTAGTTETETSDDNHSDLKNININFRSCTFCI